MERPWSEKCLTLGDDVTNYLLGVLFRVTLLLHLLDLGLFFITPLDFGLGMCWSCIGGLGFMSCNGSWSLRVLGRNLKSCSKVVWGLDRLFVERTER